MHSGACHSRYMPLHHATPAQAKPAALLFYRDGVSEGQFREVMDHEYAAIRKVKGDSYLRVRSV